MIRRGTTYGPPLPAGVLDDDGAERGIVFVFIGAHLDRQFEFVKSQWLNDGNFTGLDEEKDLLTGDNDGTGSFTIPQRPFRRRLHGVERFVITRGGEYCFLPSLSALRWIASLA
jgi:deferrochelatase/peroxidase EfeB